VVKDIRRQTRRHFSAEYKIRIVLDGLRGEDSIAELCRKEGIAQSLNTDLTNPIASVSSSGAPAHGCSMHLARALPYPLARRSIDHRRRLHLLNGCQSAADGCASNAR